MASKPSHIIGAALLLLTAELVSAQRVIDLAALGIPVASTAHCDPKLGGESVSISGISYVGDDLILITFIPRCTYIQSGNPIPYTALLIDHSGKRHGIVSTAGSLNEIRQTEINSQPIDRVILRAGRELHVYDTTFQQTVSIKLPERAEVSLTPDRKRIAIFAIAGAEAEVSLATLDGSMGPPRHLAFNELAVRNRKVVISNFGDVAHAVPESDPELGVVSDSNPWPKTIPPGKYHVPLAFVCDHTLLASIMSTRPFPPTNLYLWDRSGKVQKVSGSKGESFQRPQVSMDGQRVLISKTKGNFFREMLGGFDCGACGDSYSYLLLDIPAHKVIKELHPHWQCTDALSPSGHEVAELCGQTLSFFPEP